MVMPHPLVSSCLEAEIDGLKPDDANLIERICAIWSQYQAHGIEARHTIGLLLNERLGPPGNRQRYAQAVIKAVARKVGTDETNISRFRRFADQFPTYGGFCEKYPHLTSWTQVREMLKQTRKSVSGHRRAWGLVRSLRAAVESLKLNVPLDSSRASEVSRLLQELIVAVRYRDDLTVPLVNEHTTVGPQLAPDMKIIA